jgi:choline dehydrogenase-like flavoprotein
MLMQGPSLAAGVPLRCRFCVVGSGMGGAAIAERLAEAGQDVLVVEAGGTGPDAGNGPVLLEQVGRPFGVPMTRSIELGGTSGRWHGICGSLDAIDFEARPWMPASGWPVGPLDVARYYHSAARRLGIADGADLEARLDARLKDRLQDIEFDRSLLENKLVRVCEPPVRWKHTLLGLARAGKLRCLVDAPALELTVSADGQRVAGVVVGAGQRVVRIDADVVVLCAGALETPRLLLNSRRRLGAGIGNAHDLVGRYLLDHPMGHFCKLGFYRRTDAPLYACARMSRRVRVMAGLRLSAAQQQRHTVPNHYLWIRPSVSPARIDDDLLLSFLSVRSARDLSLRQLAAICTNRDILYRILVHRFGLHPTYRYGDCFFMTEQVPSPRSRVTLSPDRLDRYGYPVARVDWRLGEEDLRGFAAYTELLFGMGLRSPRYALARLDSLSVWRRTLVSAFHHLGTARMADCPSRGVVDAQLQVFGMRNLFVCDGSVFPTAGGVNPSLTIVALALRLGEHLLRWHPGA